MQPLLLAVETRLSPSLALPDPLPNHYAGKGSGDMAIPKLFFRLGCQLSVTINHNFPSPAEVKRSHTQETNLRAGLASASFADRQLEYTH